jgi:hypothetical protein
MAGQGATIFTTTISATTFTVPDGATEIFMNNIGTGDATWIGNSVLYNGATPTPSTVITLPKGQSFSYGYIGRPRNGFVIDASATIVELSITY